jgi:hypothetical protein
MHVNEVMMWRSVGLHQGMSDEQLRERTASPRNPARYPVWHALADGLQRATRA